jgi:hypothetical protein
VKVKLDPSLAKPGNPPGLLFEGAADHERGKGRTELGEQIREGIETIRTPRLVGRGGAACVVRLEI